MKITGLRVDGYGVLADFEIRDLPAGLSVFLGPNETGKSTLLDFVRGVLFGFPDRRRRLPLHEPLRGGRHGGALFLADEAGRQIVLERHVDARAAVITGPDGALLEDSALRELLGGADDALFRSVFAFGLGELATFDSLDADEIRDLVFSAGVLGAGRSATKAARTLDQRRAQLVRPRQSDAVANGLKATLDEIDAHLRAARRDAEDFPARRRASDQIASELDEIRGAADALHRRERELERIAGCWPTWRQRTEDAARLIELGEADDAEQQVLDAETEIRRLSAEVSGHDERSAKQTSLRAQLGGIERQLAAAEASLGRPARRDVDAPELDVVDRVRWLADEERTIDARRRALSEQLDVAEREAKQAADASARAQRDERDLRNADALRDAGYVLKELRARVGDRDRTRRELANAAALSALATTHRAERVPTLSIVALIVVACAAIGILVTSRHDATAIVLGAAVLAGVLVSLVIALARPRRKPTSVSGAERRPSDAGDDEIARLSAQLGLAREVSPASLEVMETRLEDERERRRGLDELGRRATDAVARRDLVQEALEDVERAARQSRAEIETIAAGLDLDTARSADGVLAALGTLEELRELEQARRRVSTELAQLEQSATTYLADLRTMAERAHLVVAEPLDAAVVAPGLVRALDDAYARSRARTALRDAVAAADQNLSEVLGSGPDAQRLRDEVSAGEVLAWADERAQLSSDAVELDAALDAASAALHDAERELELLQRSDEIAALELERASTAEALRAALEEWVVLGLARAVVDETLARYERERQPKVIATAAALFGDVTGGRYVALVPREDVDGSRRRGIDAITDTGSRVSSSELSRGTAEQLYLCLRLAFAETFAERSVALPLLLDDVLVNFDPARAAAVARAVARTAHAHQVIAFTCHPHVVEHFCASGPTHVVELPSS